MASIKGKNTRIEILLRKALWCAGIRGYRINVKIPGKPDIVFPKYKIAIFCDGDFWHGKDFETWKDRLTPYWKEKIQKNIDRDKNNDVRLSNEKWYVFHFWECEILENPDDCVVKIIKELRRNGFGKKPRL